MGKKTMRTVGGFEYEVGMNPNLFILPRAKSERKKLLKDFVFAECDKAWRNLPRQVAVLKKEFLKEILNSF